MRPGSTTTRGTFGGQILKRWFVTGTTSRTAAGKLVKNLKHAKTGLAINALDQFVMKFWGLVRLWNG